MAKGVFVGVGGIPRKVKKVFVGVNNVARKVKKVYVGVGGVPKLTYSEGISYNRTIISELLDTAGASSNANYAVFGGGQDTAVAFNSLFVQHRPQFRKRWQVAGGSIGQYALLAGGFYNPGSNAYYVQEVNAYNLSLVHTEMMLRSARQYPFSASNSSFALFVGGSNSGTAGVSDMEAFNASLVRTYASHSYGIYHHGVASAGNYIIVTGGQGYNNPGNETYAYDINISRLKPMVLTGRMSQCKGANTVNRAMFGNVYPYTSAYESFSVDTYDGNLVKTSCEAFHQKHPWGGAVGTSEFVMFAGGQQSSDNIIETYDLNLVHSYDTNLNEVRCNFGATTLGDYVLLGYGASCPGNINSNTVEVLNF